MKKFEQDRIHEELNRQYRKIKKRLIVGSLIIILLLFILFLIAFIRSAQF